jgi:hypothetical protein
VANNPLESADKKYYASRTPLNLQGTKEGRKVERPAFSYRQKPNDTTASSNKYYASPEQPAPVSKPAAIKQPAKKRFRFRASDKVLQDVVGGFQEGGTVIEIIGAAVDITKARAAIDLAVGRNTLTREQADAVTFITEHPQTPEEVNPPKKKATKKKATKKKVTKRAKKKTPRKKTKKAEDLVASVLADNLSDETKDEVLKNGWEGDDGITEKDVAAAFGVTDDDDDDDSDD